MNKVLNFRLTWKVRISFFSLIILLAGLLLIAVPPIFAETTQQTVTHGNGNYTTYTYMDGQMVKEETFNSKGELLGHKIFTYYESGYLRKTMYYDRNGRVIEPPADEVPEQAGIIPAPDPLNPSGPRYGVEPPDPLNPSGPRYGVEPPDPLNPSSAGKITAPDDVLENDADAITSIAEDIAEEVSENISQEVSEEVTEDIDSTPGTD